MNHIIVTEKIKGKIGRSPMVILSLEEYEGMREELEMLSSKKLAGKIHTARREALKGNIVAVSQVKRKLGLR